MKIVDSTSHKPQDVWVFDDEVVNVFDDMLDRSIPLYKQVYQLIIEVLKTVLVPNGGTVLDLGVSTANSFTMIEKGIPNSNIAYIGVDSSPAMLVQSKSKFQNASYYGGRVQEFCSIQHTGAKHKISLDGLSLNVDVTLLSLLLQFVPMEHRQEIVSKIVDRTNVGGVVVLFEKCLGSTMLEESLYTNLYYKYKEESGYSMDSILEKRRSLENVLVPATLQFNIKLLENAGLRTHVLFSWCNFNLIVGYK